MRETAEETATAFRVEAAEATASTFQVEAVEETTAAIQVGGSKGDNKNYLGGGDSSIRGCEYRFKSILEAETCLGGVWGYLGH